MALRTFTGALTPDLRSSQAGNWDTGVPVDTDTWIIPVGLTCEWDSDQSGFATGTGGKINGTLEASTTPGYYCIKLSENLTGTGTLRAGTSVTAYPQTCTFEILFNGFTITGTKFDLNCTEPTTYKFALLTGAEAIGQTVLEIDRNLIGDIWADGDIVRICDINGFDSEERVIAAGGIAANSITVTAGLTNAKIAGAYVLLMTRNVRLISAAEKLLSTTNGRIGAMLYKVTLNTASNMVLFGAYSLHNQLYAVHTSTISAVIYGHSGGGYSCLNGSSGTVFTSGFIGCSNYGVIASYAITMAGKLIGCSAGVSGVYGLVMSGSIIGCGTGINDCSDIVVTGTISGSTGYSISNSSGVLYGAVLSGAASGDIYMRGTAIKGYNSTLSSATQANYAASYTPTDQVAIWDIGGVAGAFKAWMRGGRVQSQAGVVPTGRTVAYQHICESADYPVVMDRSADVEPGDTITATVWLRKDAAMPGYLPRCQLFRIENDPLLGGATLASATMTDSIDTWEEFELEWTNDTAGPVTVVLRTLAQNAANNVYADSLILNGGEEVGGGSPFTGVFG